MRVDLRHGDCVDLMRAMPECSVDSIVTDPPYGLEFMGKEWDAPWKGSGTVESVHEGQDKSHPFRDGSSRVRYGTKDMPAFQAWFETVAAECLRVLKPGGHLLAFGGTRTYHRMACAIEDAGFEIRDSIHWVYGSGFPKSLNVGKAIDKRRDERHEEALLVTVPMAEAMRAKGLTRRDLNVAVGREPNDAGSAQSWTTVFADGAHKPRVPTVEQWAVLRDLLDLAWLDDEVWRLNGRKGSPGEAWSKREVTGQHDRPDPRLTTWAEMQGNPRGVAKKRRDIPATDEARRWEGWGTALKPAHEPIVVARKPLSGTVAGNVLVWGTGGLNIDGCRVGTEQTKTLRGVSTVGEGGWKTTGGDALTARDNPPGRWPANIVLDGAAAAALDQQSGVSKSSSGGRSGTHPAPMDWGKDDTARDRGGHTDSGGASRFFTQADFGPDDWPFVYQAKPSKRERNAGLDGLPEQAAGSLNMRTDAHAVKTDNATQERQNHHPTVKPVALMRHLVRLVTPPGGTVLDPFAGSGTTLVAAVLEGMHAIGCEMTDEYLPIIEGRVAWAEEQAQAAAEAEANPEQPTLL
jgi:DNA modification methylase